MAEEDNCPVVDPLDHSVEGVLLADVLAFVGANGREHFLLLAEKTVDIHQAQAGLVLVGNFHQVQVAMSVEHSFHRGLAAKTVVDNFQEVQVVQAVVGNFQLVQVVMKGVGNFHQALAVTQEVGSYHPVQAALQVGDKYHWAEKVAVDSFHQVLPGLKEEDNFHHLEGSLLEVVGADRNLLGVPLCLEALTEVVGHKVLQEEYQLVHEIHKVLRGLAHLEVVHKIPGVDLVVVAVEVYLGNFLVEGVHFLGMVRTDQD